MKIIWGGGGGPGIVRNVGLDRALGKYVYFMDSDDVILPHGLETLLKAIDGSELDVVVTAKFFSMGEGENKSVDENADIRLKGNGSVGMIVPDLKRRLFDEYFHWGTPASVYCAIYRHSFLKKNDVRFRDAPIHEDGVFLVEVLCATNKLLKIAEPFYIYRWRTGSVTKPSDPLDFDMLAKRVRSLLIVMEHFENIISWALLREYGEVDQYFVDNACLVIKNRAIVRPMMNFYKSDPIKCWEVVRAEVERRYGTDTALLRKLMAGYLTSSLSYMDAEQEIFQLRTTMKSFKETVNKVIPF